MQSVESLVKEAENEFRAAEDIEDTIDSWTLKYSHLIGSAEYYERADKQRTNGSRINLLESATILFSAGKLCNQYKWKDYSICCIEECVEKCSIILKSGDVNLYQEACALNEHAIRYLNNMSKPVSMAKF
jgi:hypothetical protein